ncbi:MAG: hypothetical protein KJZ83_14790 [Burkholderiaceae bacterium]|nr:hypothetical protein [Burkholderiaceae bacterium]
MTSFHTIVSVAALATASLAASAWAVAQDQHDARLGAQTSVVQLAQATPGRPGMGMRSGAAMPGYGDQMKAMQEMHDKMMAAKTPEERNALMAEQMKLMQNGMNMMGGMGGMGGIGGMGPGGASSKPGDMGARQGMMEQRMDMMQSMMQMMMDRMHLAPATK